MNHICKSRVSRALFVAASIAVAGAAQAGSAPPIVQSQDTQMVSSAQTPSAGAMAVDLVVVRPLSLAATVIGSVLFVANLPLSVFEKNAPAAPFHRLVVEPLKFTFQRPLGSLN